MNMVINTSCKIDIGALFSAQIVLFLEDRQLIISEQKFKTENMNFV